MPIYDNDGTTNYQIGKVYDNDGTAQHQIGKVYDWDGTASSLIYSADETFEISKKSADGTVNQMKWFNTPVTGFTSVTLTIVVDGTQDIFYGGIGTQQASGAVSTTAPSGALYNVKSVNGDKKGTHSKTLSLNASATYYLYAGVYTGNKANNGSVKVTAIFS